MAWTMKDRDYWEAHIPEEIMQKMDAEYLPLTGSPAAQLSLGTAGTYKDYNPQLELMSALARAQNDPAGSREEVYFSAIHAGDFVTAEYWCEPYNKQDVRDFPKRFRNTAVAAAAKLQRTVDPSAVPMTKPEQMLRFNTQTGKLLRDPRLDAAKQRMEQKETEIYREHFRTPTREMQEARAEEKRLNKIASPMWILLIVAAILGVFFGIPRVWRFCGHLWATLRFGVFGNLAVNIVVFFGYIILLGVVLFLFANRIPDTVAAVNAAVQRRLEEAERAFKSSDEYKLYHTLVGQIPEDYRDGKNRILLATMSMMYGEEDIRKLTRMLYWKVPARWMRSYTHGATEYDAIDMLLVKDAPLADAVVAYYLCVKCTTNSYFNASHQFFNEELHLDLSRIANNLYNAASREDSLRHLRKKAPYMYQPMYDFFMNACRQAKIEQRTEDLPYLMYLLFRINARAGDLPGNMDRAERFAKQAISLGSCDAFAEVMTHAIDSPGSRLALGYSRSDAQTAVRTLRKLGRPDLADKLLHQMELNDAYEAQMAREAEAEARKKQKEAAERRRAQLESDYDAWERDANFASGYGYQTDEDRLISQEIDFLDYQRKAEKRQKYMDDNA